MQSTGPMTSHNGTDASTVEAVGLRAVSAGVRDRVESVLEVVTRRLRPEECLFGIFFVALFVVVLLTGKIGIVSHRVTEVGKYFGTVFGVAFLIFLRAYFREVWAGEARWLDAARARGSGMHALRTLREFGPLFACLTIYEALHDLTPILRPKVEDHFLVSADHWLFGVDVGRFLDDHIGSAPMTTVMTYCYVSYAFASPIYAGLQFFRGKFRAFHDFALAITITAFIGYSGYMLMPAVGPYVYQHALYPDALPGWGHGGILDIIAKLKGSARDAFPSLHTAMTTVVLGMMWRDARRLFWTYLPIALGLYLATMYLRVHYATDVIAGFVTASIALSLTPKINNWWYGRRVPREAVVTIPAQREPVDELVPVA